MRTDISFSLYHLLCVLRVGTCCSTASCRILDKIRNALLTHSISVCNFEKYDFREKFGYR